MLNYSKKNKKNAFPRGFKTLALGVINLTEVLQSTATVKDISLYSDLSDVELNDVTSPTAAAQSYSHHRTPATAKLYLHLLNSQPLEQDDSKVKGKFNI